jgi:hypothetical protein
VIARLFCCCGGSGHGRADDQHTPIGPPIRTKLAGVRRLCRIAFAKLILDTAGLCFFNSARMLAAGMAGSATRAHNSCAVFRVCKGGTD